MLQLNEDYRIRCDTLNIILERRVIRKNDEESWSVEGYYGKWQHAFQRLVSMELMESADIQEVRQKFDMLMSMIDGLDDRIIQQGIGWKSS